MASLPVQRPQGPGPPDPNILICPFPNCKSDGKIRSSKGALVAHYENVHTSQLGAQNQPALAFAFFLRQTGRAKCFTPTCKFSVTKEGKKCAKCVGRERRANPSSSSQSNIPRQGATYRAGPRSSAEFRSSESNSGNDNESAENFEEDQSQVDGERRAPGQHAAPPLGGLAPPLAAAAQPQPAGVPAVPPIAPGADQYAHRGIGFQPTEPTRRVIFPQYPIEEMNALFEEASTKQFHAALKVPGAVLTRYSLLLESLLFENTAIGTVVAALGLLLAPRALAKPRRRQNNYEQWFHTRLDHLEAGRYKELMEETPQFIRKYKESNEKDRINKFLKEGNLSRLSKEMTSNGIAPPTEATEAKLREKIIDGPDIPLPDNFTVAPIQASMAQVKKAIFSFRDDASKGPFGHSARDLKKFWKDNKSGQFRNVMRDFVNTWLAGKLSKEAAQSFNSANLIALNKGESDVRPIAIGEVLRRLVMKIAMEMKGFDVSAGFGNLQTGVRVAGGAEAIVYSVREYVELKKNNPDCLVVNIDIENAFGSISREAILKEVLENHADLAPLVFYTYSSRSLLIWCDKVFYSTQGVQQGDPIGGLLFCIGLHPVLRRVRDGTDTDFFVFFYDDGSIGGKIGDVEAALALFTSEAAEIGLRVSKTKCFALRTSGPVDLGDQDAMDVEPNPPPPRPYPDFGARLGIANTLNLKTLGVLINRNGGEQQYPAAQLKTLKFMGNLSKLSHSQHPYSLIRLCGPFSRGVYFMRTSPPSEISGFLQLLSNAVLSGGEQTFGSMTPDQWSQAKLAASKSGLGLRSLSEHHAPAQIGCILQTLPLVRSILIKVFPGNQVIPPHISNQLTNAIGVYNRQVSESKRILVDPALLTAAENSQKILSKNVDAHSFDQLYQRSDLLNRRRLRELRAKGSGAFLSAPLNFVGYPWMDSSTFMTAVKFRLGDQFVRSDTNCPFKTHKANRAHTAGPLCSGFLSCKAGGHPIQIHNTVARQLGAIATEAGIRVRYEEPDLLPQGRKRPGDCRFLEYLENRSCCVDVCVVNGLAYALTAAEEANPILNAPLNARELHKITKYRADLTANGYEFKPFAITVYGMLGIQASLLVLDLAVKVARYNDLEVADTTKRIRILLSIALQSEIAHSLQKHFGIRVPGR